MISKTKFEFNGKVFNEHLYDEQVTPPYYHGTTCCAMGFLSLNCNHSIQEIKDILAHIKRDSLTKTFKPSERRFGERNIVTIVVHPKEDQLEINLISLGWKCIAKDLPRRNGYPKDASLRMYLYSF